MKPRKPIGVGRRTFDVREPDYDSDWKTVRADDHRDAAVTFAEATWSQRDFYTDTAIEVRETGAFPEAEATRFNIVVESAPVFHAEEAS